MSAIGGENVTTTVEGRERYPVNVRYMRDFRSDIAPRARAGAGHGRADPDSDLATRRHEGASAGPSMLRDENGMLNGYVYVDVAGRDVGGYVEEAKRLVRKRCSCRPATRCSGAASTSPCSACARS